MRSRHLVMGVVVLAAIGLVGKEIRGQQVTVGTPFRTTTDNFFEQNGVNFSGHWGGIQFQSNNSALARPQFGGFNAGAGLSTAFGIQNGNFNVNFGLNFGQGNTRSAVSQTPSVTLMNGQTGYFSDTSQTPFVISEVPVVGGAPIVAGIPMASFNPFMAMGDNGAPPMLANPRLQEMLQRAAARQQADNEGGQLDVAPAVLPPANPAGPRPAGNPGVGNPAAGNRPPAGEAPRQAALPAGPAERLFAAQESSAGRAAPSLAEARRLHELENGANEGDLLALMERARTAEEDGKPGVAKIYYQRVAKHAAGGLREQAQERLDALRNGAAPVAP